MIRHLLSIACFISAITFSRANNWQLALEHNAGITSFNIDRKALNEVGIQYRDIHPFIYATYTSFVAKYDFKDFAFYLGLSHFSTGSGTNFFKQNSNNTDYSDVKSKLINHHIGMPIGIAYKVLYHSHKVYPFLYVGIEPALNFEPVFRNYPGVVEDFYRAAGDLNTLFSLYTNLGFGVGYKFSEKIDLEFSFNYIQDITNFANTSVQNSVYITGTNLIRDYQLSWGIAVNYNLKPHSTSSTRLEAL